MKWTSKKSVVVAVAIPIIGVAAYVLQAYAYLVFERRPVAEMVATLQLQPGQRAADIGAGDGTFTFPIAEKVGTNGIVYAVEVEDDKVQKIAAVTQKRGLNNVRVILGGETDPQLPEAVDLVVIINVLHHIEDRAGYLRNLPRHLRPNARVAIIDFTDRWPPFHGTKKYTVADLDGWMQAAGFEKIASHDFIAHQFYVIYQQKIAAPKSNGIS